MLSLRLPPDLYQILLTRAKTEGKSIASLMVELTTASLKSGN